MSDLSQTLKNQFAVAIAAAKEDPEAVNHQRLWQIFEQLQGGEEWEQLQLVGDAILQLAELYEYRAKFLLTDWKERHSDLGPPVEADLLCGLVRCTLYLDVSDLTKSPTRRRAKNQPEPEDYSSVVQSVEKEKVLSFVQAQEASIQTQAQALAVAHDEDVSAWIRAIQTWVKCHAQGQEQVTLLELQQGTNLPIVKLWLALLLGQFEIEQRGEFYERSAISIRLLA